MATMSPIVKKYAVERGVDPRQVRGTGKNGAITRKDVDRHLLDAGRPAGIEPETALKEAEAQGKSPWADAAEAGEKDLRQRLEDAAALRQQDKDMKERRRAATAPWTSADQSWKPDRNRVPKIPGWARRWFLEDKVEYMKQVGWRVASAKRYDLGKDPIMGTTGSVGDYIKRGRRILMEIPESWNEDFKKVLDQRVVAQTADEYEKAIHAGFYKRGSNFGKPRRGSMALRAQQNPHADPAYLTGRDRSE